MKNEKWKTKNKKLFWKWPKNAKIVYFSAFFAPKKWKNKKKEYTFQLFLGRISKVNKKVFFLLSAENENEKWKTKNKNISKNALFDPKKCFYFSNLLKSQGFLSWFSWNEKNVFICSLAKMKNEKWKTKNIFLKKLFFKKFFLLFLGDFE